MQDMLQNGNLPGFWHCIDVACPCEEFWLDNTDHQREPNTTHSDRAFVLAVEFVGDFSR